MDSFYAVARYMQDGPTLYQDVWFVVVTVGGIALLWSGITLWDGYRARNSRKRQRYESLFVELCQAHKLPHAESEWLQHAATRYEFDDPARIFFTPQAIEVNMQSEKENEEIARSLMTKLFGRGAPADA